MTDIFILKSRLDKRGGAEKYTRRFIDALVKKKRRVTLITSRLSAPPLESPYLTIHSLNHRHLLSVSKVRSFDQFCLRYTKEASCPIFSLDRTTYQTHLRASNGVHAAYLSHRKVSPIKALSTTLNPLHRTLLKYEKIAFEHPKLQALITNSHLVKQEILRHYRVEANMIHVVHNGVEWREKQEAFQAWPEIKKEDGAFHFLFVGHNFARKGLTPLLHALSLLRRSDIHLSVVGVDKNPSMFVRLAEKLQLKNRVRFYGFRPDITPFYQRADALVIPSYYDPFANVTVEALAMGLFVVSSKTNGGHEVLTPESGCTIESLADPSSIAASLTHALSFKKTEKRALDIRYSIKHLDFTNQLEKITELLPL